VRRLAVAVSLAGAVAGCGSDEVASPSPGVVLLVESDAAGAADAVEFAAVPEVLVTVDGRVIYAAPQEVAIRGELLPDVWVQTLSSDGVEMVRNAVDEGFAPGSLTDLQAFVDAELGSTQFYLPDAYRFQAIEFGPEAEFDDPVVKQRKAVLDRNRHREVIVCTQVVG
jgi:hypothetical protein